MAIKNMPQWVLKHKEKGKTIKEKNGKYYLYEHKCVYDKNRPNKNYVKDTYIGRITEDNGLILAGHFSNAKAENLYSKEYGSYALFTKLGDSILERLKKYFGDKYALLIFVIACLRVKDHTQYCELEDEFQDNYFSASNKNLNMSKSYLSDFLEDLSHYKDNMTNFMREDITEDDIIIFDGTNLLCGSNNVSYVGYGYKHGHNYNSQVNELYAFSAKNRKAVYYKLLEGSVSDKATLQDVLLESKISNAIALIDNGFESDNNINSLLTNKNKYIMALKRSSSLVPEEILKDFSREEAREYFVNNHETIYAYETKDENGDRICIYFNKSIESIESSEYIEKMSKGVKGYTKENIKKAQERFGIFNIKTNIEDFSLQKIYEYYKSRFEIEYMFDTVKNTLGYDKTFMHSDKSIESWAFINHISIIMTQKIYDYMNEKGVNISLHQLFKKLKLVKKIKSNLDTNDNYEFQGIPKKVRDLLAKLEITD